jgi:hypothetical protein
VLRKKFLTGRADYHLGQKHPARLSPEFPGWTAMTLLLLAIGVLGSLLRHSILPALHGITWLLIGVLSQAILTARSSGTGWHSIARHAAVIFFESAFEFGRLIESLRHGRVNRLWTKFVYVQRQLLGERDRRVRQMWACVLAFLCVLSVNVLFD